MLRPCTIRIKIHSQLKSKDLRGFRRSHDKGNSEQVRIGIQNHQREQCLGADRRSSNKEGSEQFELKLIAIEENDTLRLIEEALIRKVLNNSNQNS